MRRWVRYDAPVMVCVELDADGHVGQVVNVVLGTDPEDLTLARDVRGDILVYDEHMQRAQGAAQADHQAVTIAEHREWPHPQDWEAGPDALHYPGLYDIDEPDDPDLDDDSEPVDLPEHDDATR